MNNTTLAKLSETIIEALESKGFHQGLGSVYEVWQGADGQFCVQFVRGDGESSMETTNVKVTLQLVTTGLAELELDRLKG